MQRKTEDQLVLAENLRVARTLVRLKHSNAAYRELNDILPSVELEHVKGLQGGRLKALMPKWADDLADSDATD